MNYVDNCWWTFTSSEENLDLIHLLFKCRVPQMGNYESKLRIFPWSKGNYSGINIPPSDKCTLVWSCYICVMFRGKQCRYFSTERSTESMDCKITHTGIVVHYNSSVRYFTIHGFSNSLRHWSICIACHGKWQHRLKERTRNIQTPDIYRVGQKKGYRNCISYRIRDKFDKNTTKHTINRYMCV